MTERNLSINLNTFGEKETSWIHLFQEDLPTDEIDQQEAAEIIDAAFDIVPCFEGEQEVIDKDDPTTWDKIAAIIKKVAGATFCEKNEDGGWDLIIKVAVSDITKSYTLLVDGGALGTTQTVTEIVSGTKLVENASQFTFDFPVLGNAVFECPVPFVIDGSTVYFASSVTTHLIYSYATQYDRVTITTKPEYGEDNIPTVQEGFLDLRKYDNGQIGQLIEKPCTITGLYSGKSRQITLELPEVDDSIEEPEAICLTEEGTTATGGSRVCYEQITHITDCQCGDRTYPGDRLRIEKVVVPCPEGIKDCGAINPGCTSVVSRTERYHYVICPDVDDTWDGDTREFYYEKCCEWPAKDFPLPRCKIRTTSYVGNKSIEKGEQYWKDHYSYANVSFHPVTPQNGVCGKTIVEQVLKPKNCCDEVAPLVWNSEESAEVTAPNSMAEVFVSGGTDPKTWQVRGSGFWTDPGHTERDKIVTGNMLQIYTDEDACGTAQIHVDDGCSTVSGTLLSTQGVWFLLPEGQFPPMELTTDSGSRIEFSSSAAQNICNGVGVGAAASWWAYGEGWKARQSFCFHGRSSRGVSLEGYDEACALALTAGEVYSRNLAFIQTRESYVNPKMMNYDPMNAWNLTRFTEWYQDYSICGDDYICEDHQFMQSGGRFTCDRDADILWPAKHYLQFTGFYEVWKWECSI